MSLLRGCLRSNKAAPTRSREWPESADFVEKPLTGSAPQRALCRCSVATGGAPERGGVRLDLFCVKNRSMEQGASFGWDGLCFRRLMSLELGGDTKGRRARLPLYRRPLLGVSARSLRGRRTSGASERYGRDKPREVIGPQAARRAPNNFTKPFHRSLGVSVPVCRLAQPKVIGIFVKTPLKAGATTALCFVARIGRRTQ
jgi:hypothetical protein